MALDDLMDETFGPADIQAATGGAVNSNALRLWNKREFLVVPRDAAPSGRPAPYKLVHVYIAALLNEASKHRIPLEEMSLVIKRRLGGPEGFVQDKIQRLASNPGKTFRNELRDRDAKRPWFWILFYSPGASAKRHRSIIGHQVVRNRKQLGDALLGDPIPDFACVMNVTSVLTRVDEVLRSRISERRPK